MSALTERNPPREGTNAAVFYWAARTREAMRFAETMLAEGDGDDSNDSARYWADEAADCAGEFQTAIEARLARREGWA